MAKKRLTFRLLISISLVIATNVAGQSYVPVQSDAKMAREGLDSGRALITQREHTAAKQALQKAEIRAELATVKSNAARLRAEVQVKETENANLRRELLGEGQVP